MYKSTVTEEDRKFVETWENIAQKRIGIIRLDPRGVERQELIVGRRQFMVTTEERIITQDRIKARENDPFMNGSFRPVVVPDSVTIESNPNALSDEEIAKILGSSDIAWAEWLKTIDSVATVRRMLDMAEEVDVSHKRYRQLEARLKEVRPNQIQINDPALKAFVDPDSRPGPTANVAASGAGNPRRQGGRSSDYR